MATVALTAASTAAAPVQARCDDEPQACAKDAFDSGIAAFREERYEEALGHFRAAHELRPHPVVLFNVALAEAKSGLVVEALRHLEQVYDDPATPESYLGRVRRERQATAKLLARISLEEHEGARLVVDGVPTSGDPPLAEVNPGDHFVKVLVEGEVVVERQLTVAPGDKVRLSVATVAPSEREKSPATADGAIDSTERQPAELDWRRRVEPFWVYGGAGVTAVLAGATVWSGVDTRRTFEDFERDVDGLGLDERADRIDQGKAKQVRTNVLLGFTAGVGLATAATALFLVDWSDQKNGSSLALGPGHVVFRARF